MWTHTENHVRKRMRFGMWFSTRKSFGKPYGIMLVIQARQFYILQIQILTALSATPNMIPHSITDIISQIPGISQTFPGLSKITCPFPTLQFPRSLRILCLAYVRSLLRTILHKNECLDTYMAMHSCACLCMTMIGTHSTLKKWTP